MKPSVVLDCGQDFFRGREKKEINTPRLKGNLLLPHFINKTSYVSLGGHVFPFPLQFPLISLSIGMLFQTPDRSSSLWKYIPSQLFYHL